MTKYMTPTGEYSHHESSPFSDKEGAEYYLTRLPPGFRNKDVIKRGRDYYAVWFQPQSAKKKKLPTKNSGKASKRKTNPPGRLIPAKVKVMGDGTMKVFVNPKHMRQSNPSRWGTSYFVSRSAAERYYKDYEGSLAQAKIAVAHKIASGDIHIGRPPLKAGQKAFLLDGGKRYGIKQS